MSRKPKPAQQQTPAPEQAAEDAPEQASADAPKAEAPAAEASDGEAPAPAAETDAATDAAPGGEPAGDAVADEAGLEAEVAELNDKLLRALAETENVRRRAERDKADASRYAVANIARDMLSVADNLARALGSVDQAARAADPALDQLMVGVEMTQREMLSVFERYDIKPVEALGKKFDHNLHEAMFEVDDAKIAAGTVVQVVETGYVLAERLLRPSKVGVAKGGPKVAAAGATADANETADKPAKDGKTAYETKGRDPGAQLDEEL